MVEQRVLHGHRAEGVGEVGNLHQNCISAPDNLGSEDAADYSLAQTWFCLRQEITSPAVAWPL